jgi:SWI/SNF-related matrix-associated actin-dependent regulator of chromatin subfamily A-like protein 1
MSIKKSFDYSSKTKPLDHQIDAIDFVTKHDIIPLFDEQGLGKSKIVIDALCKNLGSGHIQGALIICKKSLLYTWKREIEKHSNLLPVVIDGSKNARGRSMLRSGHFYISNYETVVENSELIELLLESRKMALVLDESQKIKNPEAKVTKSILNLANLSKKRIIITGTPIANKPDDIWSQFFFLDNGALLGDDFDSFKKQFKISLKGVQDLVPYEDSFRQLQEKITSVSIRRTKDVLQLPEKVFIQKTIILAKKQQQIYDRAREELLCEITNISGELKQEEIDNYLVKLLRLTQIASNPGLIDNTYDETPAKFTALDQLVIEIVKRHEKAIIWTSFVDNVRTLKQRYSGHGARTLFGEMLIIDREMVMKKFLNDDTCKILVANPSAAKEGLTLISANNAVYLDRSFKMDDYLQSQDRIHRIGQTKTCNIFKLIADNTIDQYTDEILEKKEIVAKFLLGDSKSLRQNKVFLSKEDLVRILGGV